MSSLHLVIANKNAPSQVVLSGQTKEIERAGEILGGRILAAKAALGEFLLRTPRRPGTALATGGAITPAAGIVVFIVVAGHE